MPAIAPRAVPRRQNEAAEKGRRDLRDRGEGQEADRDERRLAGQPLVQESQRQHADDREPPHPQDERADVARGAPRPRDAVAAGGAA